MQQLFTESIVQAEDLKLTDIREIFQPRKALLEKAYNATVLTELSPAPSPTLHLMNDIALIKYTFPLVESTSFQKMSVISVSKNNEILLVHEQLPIVNIVFCKDRDVFFMPEDVARLSPSLFTKPIHFHNTTDQCCVKRESVLRETFS